MSGDEASTRRLYHPANAKINSHTLDGFAKLVVDGAVLALLISLALPVQR